MHKNNCITALGKLSRTYDFIVQLFLVVVQNRISKAVYNTKMLQESNLQFEKKTKTISRVDNTFVLFQNHFAASHIHTVQKCFHTFYLLFITNLIFITGNAKCIHHHQNCLERIYNFLNVILPQNPVWFNSVEIIVVY